MRAPIIALLLLASLSTVTSAPISKSRGLFITPYNVRYLASYIHSSGTIYDRYIYFSTGSTYDLLLKVPLVAPGEFEPHSSIRITVGLDSDRADTGVDHDPILGITDGSAYNEFFLQDRGSNVYCYPYYPTGQESNQVAEGYAAAQATFIFTPFYKYGACSTAHDGGYTNVATFSAQLDLNKEISFTVKRSDGSEVYHFYYFLVEFLP